MLRWYHNSIDKPIKLQWIDGWIRSPYPFAGTESGATFMPIVSPQAAGVEISGYINNQKVGGLYFQRHLVEQAKITNYAQELSKVPLLIAVDGEWGLSTIGRCPSFPPQYHSRCHFRRLASRCMAWKLPGSVEDGHP